MAKGRVDLLDALPDTNGNSYPAPYITLNSGTVRNPEVLVFKSGVKGTIEGAFGIPDDYSADPEIEVIWTSETTSGDVDFEHDQRTTKDSDAELLDINASPANRVDTSLNITGPSAASERMVTTFALTATDIAKDRSGSYKFSRDGVTDTKADNVSVWELYFKYTKV